MTSETWRRGDDDTDGIQDLFRRDGGQTGGGAGDKKKWLRNGSSVQRKLSFQLVGFKLQMNPHTRLISLIGPILNESEGQRLPTIHRIRRRFFLFRHKCRSVQFMGVFKWDKKIKLEERDERSLTKEKKVLNNQSGEAPL